MNIALVGCGYWGKNLVRVFYELGVLKIICDSDDEILTEKKKEYPTLKTTTNFEEILKNKDIQGIVIATPAATHYNLVKSALNSKKDVFVEKPLALGVKEGEEIVKLAREKKRVLMVGHLLLYHPAIITLENLIKRGKLGEVRYIWSNRLNFGKLRREENVLWSFAPHDIAVIIDIFGMPEKVITIGKNYLQQDIADITLSSLEFKHNKAAHIFVSWLNPFKEQKLSIIGSRAMAVFDDQAKEKLIIYPHKVKWLKNKNPEAVKAEGKIVKIPPNEPLKEEAKQFLDCIKKRKTPKTDGKEALNVLKVLEACQKSLEGGGKIINVRE
ncbi:MAG: Gfo/Idh/MocA family oxidoreductase [Candidatus Pacebacteria bacterium]|nr:Gfo/Idh/MocA family oxidoreductase [Candidatus Paceibacterota bacterium]